MRKGVGVRGMNRIVATYSHASYVHSTRALGFSINISVRTTQRKAKRALQTPSDSTLITPKKPLIGERERVNTKDDVKVLLVSACVGT